MECAVEGLNLFERPPVQSAVTHSEWVEAKPITALDKSTSTVKVHYQGKSGVTVDLARTIVKMTCIIVDANGNTVGPRQTTEGAPALAKVNVINYLIGSAFQAVDIELNGRSVSTGSNNYSQRALLEVLTSFSRASKQTWLRAGGWYDNSDGNSSRNSPAYESISEHGRYTVSGMLHLDMCHQSRHIIPNVNILLTFVFNSAKYLLTREASDTVAYGLIVTDFSVFFLENTLSDATIMELEDALENMPAIYPIRRLEARTFHISSGVKSFSEDNCFIGQLPHRVVIALVSDEAYTGSYDSSPFDYKLFGLDQIALIVGNKHIPGLPLSVHAADANSSYVWAMAGLGMLFSDHDIGLSPHDWLKRRNTIFVFNMDPHMPPDCVTPYEQGNVRIQLRFGTRLESATTAVVLAEFYNTVRIDKNRAVTTDF